MGPRIAGEVWIVDSDNHEHLMPIGCTGEVVVSGAILAREYLGDESRTKAAFIQDVSWLKVVGAKRIYKTGHLARLTSDGSVEILGRKRDGQIKLNGLRMQLGHATRLHHETSPCVRFSSTKSLCWQPLSKIRALNIHFRSSASHPNN